MTVDLQFHELLKCRLRLAGSSMAQISKTLGITQSSVTVVSQGYRRSHRIQTEIARQLNTTPEALFPDRYSGKEAHTTDET